MNQSANRDRAPEETTYDQVNAKCRQIAWPEQTAIVNGCNVIPDSAEMDDAEFRDVAQRFSNEYLYPKYEKTYFDTFPADRAKLADPQSKRDIRPLDYNRKMILTLCDWIDENGYFHYFDGRIIFIKHDAYGLSMGDLLVSGAPMNVYEGDRIAFLLNGLLHRCLEFRRKENTAMKWAIGLGIAAGLLAMIVFAIIAT